MNIYQVSVNYVNEEDRLLLRINTRQGDELQLWLTRRLSLSMAPLLEQAASAQLGMLAAAGLPPTLQAGAATPSANSCAHPQADEQRQRLLAQFQKDAISRDADYATPYQLPSEVAQNAPAPLLVTHLTLTSLASGQLDMQLSENLAGQNRQIQLLMDTPLAQGLLHLLHKALWQSQWLAPTNQTIAQRYQNADIDKEPDEAADSSLGVMSDKPRYLN